MKNSGELSDVAFAKFVGTSCLQLEVMSAFSIDLSGRFKDDIITSSWPWTESSRNTTYGA